MVKNNYFLKNILLKVQDFLGYIWMFKRKNIFLDFLKCDNVLILCEIQKFVKTITYKI